MDQPIEYLIVVKGRLDEQRADWFNGMRIEVHRIEEISVTKLRGVVRDQAALHGLLSNLYTLSLPLISVRYIQGDYQDKD
jgi:hypothetical protein